MPKRLRYFMRRDGAVLVFQHRSFPVDAGVCIAAYDRVGLQRLLRYCARHGYFGVLAPNSPLRSAVMAMVLAAPVPQAVAQAHPVNTGEGVLGLAPLGGAIPTQPDAAPPKPSKVHCLWAVLIARIYEYSRAAMSAVW